MLHCHIDHPFFLLFLLQIFLRIDWVHMPRCKLKSLLLTSEDTSHLCSYSFVYSYIRNQGSGTQAFSLTSATVFRQLRVSLLIRFPLPLWGCLKEAAKHQIPQNYSALNTCTQLFKSNHMKEHLCTIIRELHYQCILLLELGWWASYWSLLFIISHSLCYYLPWFLAFEIFFSFSHSIVNFIQVIRRFILCGLRRVTWVKCIITEVTKARFP